MGNASVWDGSAEALAKIADARDRGLDITADWYPYTAWASSLSIVVRSRQFSDPEAVAEGLAALGGPERLQITRYRADPTVEGERLDSIAMQKGRTPVEMYILMMEKGGASVIGHTMKDEDVNAFATSPYVMVCSDGGIGSAHPRGAGTFARVFAHYVRELGILSLEQAVHKMTRMPAERLGLDDRGRIEVGAVADLVAFDAENIQDNATFEEPELLSSGVEHVWVAGQLVWDSGSATGARPGRALRRQ
jgi:N-acyl-D-amino-acid deacylase